MKKVYDYLIATLLNDEYTSKNSCDISTLPPSMKNRIKQKATAILHKDVLVGNFIVYSDGERMILYKVVSNDSEEYFEISHESARLKVYYTTNDDIVLFCKCNDLSQHFFTKISIDDIYRITESLNTVELRDIDYVKSTRNIEIQTDTVVSKQKTCLDWFRIYN